MPPSSAWPYPRIIAHRGGGTLAPENTLAGMRMAKQLGFSGVEFDVMLAGDATPILMHDETLERTTSGHGAIAETAYQDMLTLDAGSWFSGAHAGEPVPSFENAGRLCIELGLWANVEIKPARGHEAQTGTAAALLARELWRGAPVQPLLSSFQPASLVAARDAAPEFARGALTTRIPPDWELWMRKLDCVSLHCDYRMLLPQQARAVRDAGYWLFCYTVDDPAIARVLFDWGVDAIATDRLDLIAPDFE
ncbi:MAG: glycerophosphodiester phosphodiesterase [Betaproteobacteria bacterium]|nr:MAG: glycerophosphodiester phosphodiesterase [Betaproteobacteria bacterium]